MSALNSGIEPSADLLPTLYKKDYRFLIIKIVDHKLEQSFIQPEIGDLQDDLEILKQHLDGCCLVLFHDVNSYLILFVPTNTTVNDRMLYSSSKGSITSRLDYACKPLFFYSTDELTIDALQEVESNPLTDREQETIKTNLELANTLATATPSNPNQLQLPMAKDLEHALTNTDLNLVVITIKNETLELEFKSNDADLAQIPSLVCFVLLNRSEFLFITPSGSKIKDKMLYSACKNAFIDQLGRMGVGITRKGEFDSVEEYEDREEVKVETVKFQKPKRPGR